MRRYTLEEIVSQDVDVPPKTFDKARRKFGKTRGASHKAYAWFYGQDSLQRQLEKQPNE